MRKTHQPKRRAATTLSNASLERMMSTDEGAPPRKTIHTAQIHVVGVVVNPHKPKAVSFAGKLCRWIEKSAKKELWVTPDTPLETIARSADFIVTVGGDGTILSLARHMTERPIPVLGVHVGGLGFLTSVRPEHATTALASLFKQSAIEIEPRQLLRARVLRRGHYQGPVFQALNDIVVNREGLTRYLKIEVMIDEEPFSHFFGDGVIVATPTGSTAYSMSAGGPVVFPTLKNMVITPICPHASALRTVVVPSSAVIRIRVLCDRKTDRALLTADGQSNFELEWGDRVECTRSPVYLPIVKSARRKYFKVLRDKFKMPLERSRKK